MDLCELILDPQEALGRDVDIYKIRRPSVLDQRIECKAVAL